MDAKILTYSYTALTVIFIFSAKIDKTTQPAVTCSKLTIETLEQGVKYVQS